MAEASVVLPTPALPENATLGAAVLSKLRSLTLHAGLLGRSTGEFHGSFAHALDDETALCMQDPGVSTGLWSHAESVLQRDSKSTAENRANDSDVGHHDKSAPSQMGMLRSALL